MSINRRVEKLEFSFRATDEDRRVPIILDGEALTVPSEVPERIERIYGDADGGLEAAA